MTLTQLPGAFSSGGQGHLEAVSTPLGPHGCCRTGGTASSPAHVACAEIPVQPGAVPAETPTGNGASHQEAVCGPQVVEGPKEHHKRQQAESCAVSLNGLCGCILRGLGHTPRRQGCQKMLGVPWQGQHINVLELRTIHLALMHFLPMLQGRQVLVRTDSTTAAAYVIRQGGLGSPRWSRMAHRLWTWIYKWFLSLRAMHVHGVMNVGVGRIQGIGGGTQQWWRRSGAASAERWLTCLPRATMLIAHCITL